MSTNDRRQERTRRLLSQALIALIAEKDFDRISVQDIVERADVARKTFYAHYADKDELLWASMEIIFESLVQQVGELSVETLLASGKPLSYPIFRHVQEHAAFYRVILSAQGSAAFILRLLDYIARTSYERHAPLRQAAPHITVPPQMIAHFLAGAALGCILWQLKQETPPTAETISYWFSQLAAPGVLAALGLDDAP